VRLIVGGFFLGIGGTAFAVGVPLVNAWFPPARRGLAIGIFGAGMGGTAVSAFSTVRLADAYGRSAPFVLVAVVLAGYAVVGALLLRNPGGRPGPAGGFLARTMARRACLPPHSCPRSTRLASGASSPSASTCPPTSVMPTA